MLVRFRANFWMVSKLSCFREPLPSRAMTRPLPEDADLVADAVLDVALLHREAVGVLRPEASDVRADGNVYRPHALLDAAAALPGTRGLAGHSDTEHRTGQWNWLHFMPAVPFLRS